MKVSTCCPRLPDQFRVFQREARLASSKQSPSCNMPWTAIGNRFRERLRKADIKCFLRGPHRKFSRLEARFEGCGQA